MAGIVTLLCGLLLLAPAVGRAGSRAADDAFAKLAPELRTLYETYRAARASGRALIPPDPAVPVVEDRVIVDAVAADSVDALEASLVALGMQNAVSAGRIVSGQLPIAQIPAMAALPGLVFARAAMVAPHSGPGRPGVP